LAGDVDSFDASAKREGSSMCPDTLHAAEWHRLQFSRSGQRQHGSPTTTIAARIDGLLPPKQAVFVCISTSRENRKSQQGGRHG